MRQFSCFLLLFFLGVNLQAQSLMGNVGNQNGEPLPGANITLDGTDIGTMADSDGFFVVFNVDEGEYKMVVSYLGFETATQMVTVKKGQKSMLDFTLEKTAFALEKIEVNGSWVNEETPVTYSNVDKEDLEKINLGQDVPFLLRWTPSAVVTSDAGTGIGYTGIRIRGSDPTRINVSINGIPLNDSESQGVFWVDLPDFASSVDQIQIQRGVGTSTNGAGAFGATINLSTTKAQNEPYVTTAHTYGSFNTLKNNISAGTGLIDNRFTFDGRFSRISSDGFIDRGSAELYSFYTSAAYLGEKESLRLNVFSGHEVTYQAWNGVPVQLIDTQRSFNPSGTEKPGEPHDNEVDDYRQTHVQLLYNGQLDEQWSFDMAGHYTRGKGFFELYKSQLLLADFNVPTPDLGAVSDLIQRRWLDNHFYGITSALHFIPEEQRTRVTLGGALNNYRGRHFGEVIWTDLTKDLEDPPIYYDNDAEKFDFNIYGKINHQLTKALSGYVDLQFRYLKYQFEDGSGISREDQLSFFNPKLGLVYRLTDQSRIYASFAVANREPNRSDYTESSLGSRPNPETLYNTELGYRQQWKKAMLGVNLYHMLYDDQLVLTGRINDVGESTRQNVDDSYRLGVELEGMIMPVNALQIGGSLTLSQNKINSFTEFIDDWDNGGQIAVNHENTDLAFSPNIIFAGEISYDVLSNLSNQSLTIALTNKYVGAQFIDNTSNDNTRLDAYTFTDFRINYQIQTEIVKDLAITLLVRNIFNSKFSTNAWTYRYSSAFYDARPDDPYAQLEGGTIYNLTGLFPQAGTNFLLGVTLGF